MTSGGYVRRSFCAALVLALARKITLCSGLRIWSCAAFVTISAFLSADDSSGKSKKMHEAIAVVDLKKVAVESEAGKNIDKKISEINEASKKDLVELETKIKSMEDDKKISEIDSRKIEDMQLILYDMVRTKRYQISEAYKKAISSLEKEIYKVVKEIAEHYDIKVVITLDVVVYVDKDCRDITDEVIKTVNERCKEIDVTVSNNKQP